MNKTVNIIYLTLHRRLENESGMFRLMNLDKFFLILGRDYRVRKKYRYAVLKEMENLKLIEKIGKGKRASEIKILKSPINIDNTSAIFHQVGLY